MIICDRVRAIVSRAIAKHFVSNFNNVASKLDVLRYTRAFVMARELVTVISICWWKTVLLSWSNVSRKSTSGFVQVQQATRCADR
jgi:hypothetical protein